MIIVRPTSLAATLDSAAEALFFQKPILNSHCEEFAMLLISRQNQTGSYSGFFIPFTAETEAPTRLFSGEVLHTDFARRHIQLIESARLPKLLAMDNHAVTQAIQLADLRMDTECYSQFCPKGECKSLTIAYMRYLTSDIMKDSRSRLNNFLIRLVEYRDNKGKWSGFPFYFTLLMLSDVDDPLATQELQYAAPSCQKQYEQIGSADPYAKRRQAIITKVLSRS